jgi:hypothetical protein
VLERRGVVEIMRTVPISQNINLRLGIKDKGGKYDKGEK